MDDFDYSELRDRAYDLEDLGQRLLAILLDKPDTVGKLEDALAACLSPGRYDLLEDLLDDAFDSVVDQLEAEDKQHNADMKLDDQIERRNDA